MNILQRWKQTALHNKIAVISGAIVALGTAITTGVVGYQAYLAKENIINEDRPWMGATASVANFEVGKKPSFAVGFQNSGKRPAEVDLTAARERSYPAFPANPDSEYIYDTTPSSSVIVPGQGLLSPSQLQYPLSQAEMDAMVSGAITYFVFGKIEYRDARTNERYYTHVCIRYLPKMKTDTDNGWRNCTEYNEVGTLPPKN